MAPNPVRSRLNYGNLLTARAAWDKGIAGVWVGLSRDNPSSPANDHGGVLTDHAAAAVSTQRFRLLSAAKRACESFYGP
jgi:hypothetical protein